MRCVFLIFFTLTACHPESKQNITKPIDNPRLFKDGGVLMMLPGVFVRSDVEASDDPAFLFRDSTNSRNTFYFTESPYLDVEEDMEEKMFSEFESFMMEGSKKSGVTCRLVENDYFLLSNGDRVFKMCYQVGEEYSTTYFVASKTRVVKVIVNNVSDDGEVTVRSMNIDPYFYVDPLPAD